MINKRLRFELNTIKDRLLEIQIEYNESPSKCGPIRNIKMNMNKGFIRVSFNTHAYLVFIYKGTYMFAWFSKVKDEPLYIQDGCITCLNVSEVCREFNDRIFCGFSPARGLKWHQYGMPKKK